MNKPAEVVLMELERLRDFFAEALPPEKIARNLLLSGEDSVNLRLWALRERMGFSVGEFAAKVNMTPARYAKYEYRGKKVPEVFLRTVGKVFSVPLAWLKCEIPL